MLRREKKNAATLILLLLSLVLLVGFYIWYKGRDTSSKGNEKGTGLEGELESSDSGAAVTEKIELSAMDPELISKLHYIHGDADIMLVLMDDLWKSEGEPDRPINQSYVKNMINLIDNVNALRIITETPADLSEYGLSEPYTYIQAEQTDGKTLILSIGDEAPGGEGCYAQINGSDTVYLLDSTYGTGLTYGDSDMTDVEKLPSITADNIYHIEVLKKDGEDFELLYDPENKIDDAGTGIFSWVILKPYEKPYAADGSKVSDLRPKYTGFKFLSCADYSGKDPGRYGLYDPAASILVEYYETRTEKLEKPETDPETGKEITEKTYQDEKSIKLYIGNRDSDGNYYVKKEGSDAVYTMAADKIDTILNTDPFSVMYSFISIPNIENVNKIDIEIEGSPYTMEIKRRTVKDDKGEDKTEATYYYNGKVVDEKAFKGVYQVMIAAGYDAKIPEGVTPSDQKPFLTISYYLKDKSVEKTSYLPYDESFYFVDNGSTIRFFADRRKIDAVAEAIREFKGREY